MKPTLRLFSIQWLGNLLLMLLAAAWLQIPDSHTWQLVFSLLTGALLVVALLWLYTRSFRILRSCAKPQPPWQGWLLVALFIALWCLVLVPINAGRAHEALLAGYWNSKSSPWLRYHLGYAQLVAWQERIYDCVPWLWAAVLLPFAVEFSACGTQPVNRICARSVLRHWLYWVAVLICAAIGTVVTGAVTGWSPKAGLFGQTLSILARLGLVYTIDVLLWCVVLAVLARSLNSKSN